MPMPSDPMLPAAYDDKDITALRAVAAGKANDEMQKRAMAWILYASRVYENVFHPDPHLQTYLNGGRRVGLEVVKLINMRTRNQSDSEQG